MSHYFEVRLGLAEFDYRSSLRAGMERGTSNEIDIEQRLREAVAQARSAEVLLRR